MHYLIDGYNLLFRTLHAGEDLSNQRQQLILDLNAKIELLEIDVTIVFDSTYHISESTRTHFKQLEIVFTDQGETADDYILKAIKHAKQPWQKTVVTSDKKLAGQVRRKAAKTETVEEFLAWTNQRYKNKLKQKSKPVVAAPTIPKPPATPKKIVPPKAASSETAWTDYYQAIFEKEYASLKSSEKPKHENKKDETTEKKKKKNKDKQKKHPPSTPEDDFDRWLKIFEQGY